MGERQVSYSLGYNALLFKCAKINTYKDLKQWRDNKQLALILRLLKNKQNFHRTILRWCNRKKSDVLDLTLICMREGTFHLLLILNNVMDSNGSHFGQIFLRYFLQKIIELRQLRQVDLFFLWLSLIQFDQNSN